MNHLAQSDDEAARQFATYKCTDPYPDIKPALLNSADIYDYVAATGMIYPFKPDKLKPASYEADLLGPVVYWDADNKEKRIDLQRGTQFTLKRNSIAFVTLHAKLRLPKYIALRFNLRITNVHRGILLGTGPLVDPGFEGNLVIPLHNLTTNDYEFQGGEDLIWIEFTKLSPHESWSKVTNEMFGLRRVGVLKTFPENKKNKDIDYYLSQAAPHRSIRSSISDAVESARRDAKSAARSAQWTRNFVFGIGFLSILGLSYGFYQVMSLVENSHAYVTEAHKQLETRAWEPPERFKNLETEVASLRQSVEHLREQSVASPRPTPHHAKEKK
jgi:deoxycytidine triphosphate deaminase